jgi:transcriptional regulator with XRE-family HTH domain
VTRTADEDFHRAVSERLSITRDVFGLTQKDFAERAGMARNHYNMIENGGRPLHVEDAARLCKAHYGLTLDWIYLGETRGMPEDVSNAVKALTLARQIAREVFESVTT